MAQWNPEIDVCITDSEDEEDEAMQKNFKGREAIIFVVDANLYANKNQDIFFEALEIMKGAFVSGMVVNDKELMGIVFANTEHSPEPYEPNCLENIWVPNNCAVFLPPRQLTKPIVQHLLEFLAKIEKVGDAFGMEYGIASNGGSFAEMLRLCLSLFENCGFPLNMSKIIFMTDRDTPHSPHSHEYQRAIQKAKDLEGKEVEFHVIPMVDEFDYEVFYKEFITLARDIELDSFIPPDAKQLREILSDRKLKQDFLKRTLGHFKWILGPDLEISVQYYNYFQRRNYPRKVKLLRRDNSVVQQKFQVMLRKKDNQTQEFTEQREVKVNELWYEINLGFMPIRITREQMDRIRNLHAPRMMLLGFKPKTELPQNIYYLPSEFMYPDDQKIIGSKRLFRALWQRCLERDKIAVCIFMRKRKSIPRFVALVPVQAASSDNTEHNKGVQSLLSGDGFRIFYLPMANHIRRINFVDWNSFENTAPDEGVTLFRKIVKKLRLKYEANALYDQVLEQLQQNLLSLALNIESDNNVVTQMPNSTTQDERIADFVTNFDEIFGIDPEIIKKRPASKRDGVDGDAPPNKIPKIDEEQLKNFDFIKSYLREDALCQLTIQQLRIILETHFNTNLAKSARKGNLIAKIIELHSQDD